MNAKYPIFYWISLLLWISFGCAWADPEPTVSAPPSAASAKTDIRETENADIRRLLEAVNQADTKTLFDLYEPSHGVIVHALAAMAIERTRYNLDASNKDAEICENDLFTTRPAIALLCSEFISGNLRLAGEPQAANDKRADILRHYRDHGIDNKLATVQKMLDEETKVPALAIEQPATDITLPIKRDPNLKPEYQRPIFVAKANGHDFDLLLDTGATDLVLGQDNARDFGVKPLDQTGHTSGWLAKDVPVQRGVLDVLQLGAITLHNVPVRIVPRRIALLGANLVAPLGTLRITRSAITIYAAHSDAPSCDLPMQLSSDLWGRGLRLIPEFLLNDQPHRVLLDTGASAFLVGTKAALDEVIKLRSGYRGMNDIGGSHPFANAEAAKVKMTIGNQPFNIYFIIYTDSEAKHDITLGAGALMDMDFILDFRHQHLCFPMHANLH